VSLAVTMSAIDCLEKLFSKMKNVEWVVKACYLTHRSTIPTHPGKSQIFPGFSRPWRVLENQFGSGKSWKLKVKVLESIGK